MFNDEPYQRAVLSCRQHRVRLRTPPATTCDNCGLTYYEVSGGVHVCNEYRKGETMRELTGKFQQSNTAKYPAKALAELLAAGEINREQYERLRREMAVATEHEPAARGEWRADSNGVSGFVWQGGALLATTCEPSRAEQIVTEHSSHTALVEQRDRAVEALRRILKEAEFVADAKAPFSTWVAEKCRAALNEQKGGEG